MTRVLLAALLILSACVVGPAPTPTPTAPPPGAIVPSPDLDEMTAALAANRLPSADPFELARRLGGRSGTPGPGEPVRAEPLGRGVGDRDEFFFYDFRAKRNERVVAVVLAVSENAYWYVQEGLSIDQGRLQQSIAEFEGRVLPTNRRLFGEEWRPGIDADPRMTILLGRFPDVAGYFNSADQYPRWVNPFSNEREMLYISVDAAPPGSALLLSVLAHEHAHMVQFATGARAVVWFTEAFAQLAEHASGFRVGFTAHFLALPHTQLTDWGEEPAASAAHYGHAFLFFHYLAERFGGMDLIRELMARGVDHSEDVDAVLRIRGTSMEEAYLDFVVASALLDHADPPAPFRYQELRAPPTGALGLAGRLTPPASLRASAPQYAARYYELPAGTLAIDFRGTTQVRLLPTDPRSGRHLWWSDRADGINTGLERGVDLRGVDAATLRFWTWFDIEADFDYAYVSVSADGGRTWITLAGRHTTNEDPNGNNLGDGITGRSGGGEDAVWVEEVMDLTPFAGREIRLRFDYVTDGALNHDGFAIDDLSIPQIGWQDDAETAGDWEATGFVRSTNVVAQRFGLQVIHLGASPRVERYLAAADGTALIETEVGADGALLAVSGFAPRTTQAAPLELAVERR